MKIIAITGGVATGKTTVAKILAALLKTDVIDADEIVHKFLAPGTKIYKKIVRTFGEDIVGKNTRINRKVLGQIIFGDISQRRKLERIIHPAVKKEIKGQLRRFREKDFKCVVMDIPLLFEAKMEQVADKVIVVLRNRNLQVKTLRRMKKLSLKGAKERINSQLPLSEKIKSADFVIDNNGNIQDTKKQVKEIFRNLQNIC